MNEWEVSREERVGEEEGKYRMVSDDQESAAQPRDGRGNDRDTAARGAPRRCNPRRATPAGRRGEPRGRGSRRGSPKTNGVEQRRRRAGILAAERGQGRPVEARKSKSKWTR